MHRAVVHGILVQIYKLSHQFCKKERNGADTGHKEDVHVKKKKTSTICEYSSTKIETIHRITINDGNAEHTTFDGSIV